MPIPPTLARTLAAGMLGVAMTGCQTPVEKTELPPGWRVVPDELPLRFDTHAFEAHCYNALECSVIYANRQQAAGPGPFGPPISADYRDNWGGMSHGGIRSFQPAPRIEWTSLDGERHSMEVDLEAIFRDRLVLHKVEESNIARKVKALSSSPTIIVEVNDRRVSVFMSAFIVLEKPDAAGNTFRDDLVQAWTKTL